LWRIEHEDSSANKNQPTAAHLGQVPASHAIIQDSNQIREFLIAFRPGGGPIYWAWLYTVPRHFNDDQKIFSKVVSSFRIEEWK
jgi:hypothetical protein